MLWSMKESFCWSTSKNWFKNVWSDSKNCYWPMRGSHNLLFTRLPISQRIVFANCNKFKQTAKKLDADPKTMQQINFTGNLD